MQKSIMGVMMLAAGKGSQVVVETDGPDEKEALDAILAPDCRLFRRRRMRETPRS